MSGLGWVTHGDALGTVHIYSRNLLGILRSQMAFVSSDTGYAQGARQSTSGVTWLAILVKTASGGPFFSYPQLYWYNMV